jgi:hypothetical protein
LKRLPIDALKIEKTFVAAMASDQNDRAIVRSTIELAKTGGRVNPEPPDARGERGPRAPALRRRICPEMSDPHD